MITFKLEQDGSLVNTVRGTVYQSESLMDKVHFILPKKYKEQELGSFMIALKYVNPANISKFDILTLHNGDYKEDYLEYIFPVTTEITKFAGNITFYLSMYFVDEELNQKYIGHSGESTLQIEPVNDYFTDENSLQAIDQKIFKLEELAAEYQKSKADNIAQSGNEIYLTSAGKKIGDSIEVQQGSGEIDLSDGVPVIEFGEPHDVPLPDDEDDNVVEF